jgi:hypothetical protein
MAGRRRRITKLQTREDWIIYGAIVIVTVMVGVGVTLFFVR